MHHPPTPTFSHKLLENVSWRCPLPTFKTSSLIVKLVVTVWNPGVSGFRRPGCEETRKVRAVPTVWRLATLSGEDPRVSAPASRSRPGTESSSAFAMRSGASGTIHAFPSAAGQREPRVTWASNKNIWMIRTVPHPGLRSRPWFESFDSASQCSTVLDRNIASGGKVASDFISVRLSRHQFIIVLVIRSKFEIRSNAVIIRTATKWW